jgi:hypothetical protein
MLQENSVPQSRQFQERMRCSKSKAFLTRFAESRTLLEGRGVASRVSFKAFIGLPLSLSCFQTLQDYQSFHFALRREAQRRGFVSHMVFFLDHATGREELRNTLEEFGVRFVVWFLPGISAQDIVLRLKDKGIRVIGISDGGMTALFCKYEIRREKALVTVLRKWRADDGITHATIVRSSVRSAGGEEMLEQATEKARLSYEYKDVDDEVDGKVISSLGRDRRTGLILPGRSAAVLSLRAPRAFGELLSRCRVALPDGPTTTLYGTVPDGPVDLLTVNWPFVAKRIVHDLGTKRRFTEPRPTIFEASAHFRVCLRDYSDAI